MRLGKTIAVLAIAGALLALPATATGPQQKPNASNQPARTATQRAAAKLQTDLTKNRVRGIQSRAMRDAESYRRADEGTFIGSTASATARRAPWRESQGAGWPRPAPEGTKASPFVGSPVSDDGTDSASTEPRLRSTGDDTPR